MAPITTQERAQIIEGAFAAGGTALSGLITSGAAAGSFTGVATTAVNPLAAPLLPLVPPLLGLLAQTLRPRFPRLEPSEIGQAVQETISLRARGLEPVVSTDPFTGNVAISTVDQAGILDTLLAEAAARKLPPPTPSQEAFELREALIAGLEASAVDRGFFASTADIPQGLRGGVFRPTADAPIQFVQFER